MASGKTLTAPCAGVMPTGLLLPPPLAAMALLLLVQLHQHQLQLQQLLLQ